MHRWTGSALCFKLDWTCVGNWDFNRHSNCNLHPFPQHLPWRKIWLRFAVDFGCRQSSKSTFQHRQTVHGRLVDQGWCCPRTFHIWKSFRLLIFPPGGKGRNTAIGDVPAVRISEEGLGVWGSEPKGFPLRRRDWSKRRGLVASTTSRIVGRT